MKIKKLMPMDAESRRLIDWMEKGVYDALQKKYLKTLLFCICEEIAGPMIEEYTFSFSYSTSDSEEVSMNVNRIGNKKNGATFKSNTMDITPDQMRSSACKMVRTLVQLMRTLDQMPDERTVLMKLLYYDDVTPENYEPPFFRCCSESEAPSKWTKNPLKMEVGNVNSKHLVLVLKVKSVLDPCEDENDDVTEDEVSLGGGSAQEDDSSSSDSEVRPSFADQFVVAPIAHEVEQTVRIKEWMHSRHTSTFDLADVLSSFPDISVASTEAIMEGLLKAGLISEVGKDCYIINKEKESNPVCDVKQEVEMQDVTHTGKINQSVGEDYMYMKALYHALPLDYVTIAKLQNKLSGEANQNAVRKLIEKMTQDGYVKNSGNKRLGKRVVHSESSNRKLVEAKKMIEGQPMEIETKEQPFDFVPADSPPTEHHANVSTCGGLHSIGSDLTRTRGRSEACQNGSIRSGQQGNTPTSKAAPLSSLESGVARKEAKCQAPNAGEESNGTQDKRSRRSSMVKEPILQYVKRQKSHA